MLNLLFLRALLLQGVFGKDLLRPVLFRPFQSASEEDLQYLIAPPEKWIREYSMRVMKLKTSLNNPFDEADEAYARSLYLEVLMQFLMGTVFGKYELSVGPNVGVQSHEWTCMDPDKRTSGEDWPGLAMTMTGRLRMEKTISICADVFKNNIEGDILEAGVWRGGMSIYLRGIMRAFGQKHRLLFACDSFAGLPPSTLIDDLSIQWDQTPYLEIPDSVVAHNFITAGMTDENIVFVKGFFSQTMKPLREYHSGKFSILRLDGDMYESTVDVLYHFYDKLSLGGYVIMDDWFGFPSKVACEHFFKVHDISPDILKIDDISIYWKKTEDVEVQYWRYERKQFI